MRWPQSKKIENLSYEIAPREPIWTKIIKNKMLVIGGTIVALVFFTAIFAPLLSKYDTTAMDFDAILSPPSFEHFFGTDQYGRDILTRIIYGARISIFVGTASVAIAISFGILIGGIAGYVRGIVR